MIAILALALLLILIGLVCWLEAVADLVDAGPLRRWQANLRMGLAGLALLAWGFLLLMTVRG